MNIHAQPQEEGFRNIFQSRDVSSVSRILNLDCGLGRISINLAKAGYEVLGVESSPLYLTLAQKSAKKESVDGKTIFYRMDLRNAPRLLASKAEKFDAMINVGTSFGFHDESYDRQLFRSLTTLALVDVES